MSWRGADEEKVDPAAAQRIAKWYKALRANIKLAHNGLYPPETAARAAERARSTYKGNGGKYAADHHRREAFLNAAIRQKMAKYHTYKTLADLHTREARTDKSKESRDSAKQAMLAYKKAHDTLKLCYMMESAGSNANLRICHVCDMQDNPSYCYSQ